MLTDYLRGLSRRERERASPGQPLRGSAVHPLPKGEGWGEGERDVELTRWASFSRRVSERFGGRGGRARLSAARRIKYWQLPGALGQTRPTPPVRERDN